jgi:hypothetical protein
LHTTFSCLLFVLFQWRRTAIDAHA